jgi:hypothetical protein
VANTKRTCYAGSVGKVASGSRQFFMTRNDFGRISALAYHDRDASRASTCSCRVVVESQGSSCWVDSCGRLSGTLNLMSSIGGTAYANTERNDGDNAC